MKKIKDYIIADGLGLMICLQSIAVGAWSLLFLDTMFVRYWPLNLILCICGLLKLIGLITNVCWLKRIGLFGVAFVWIAHMYVGIEIGLNQGFHGTGWISSIFFVLLIWMEAIRGDY